MRIIVINATTDMYGANRVLALALKSLPKNSNTQLWLPDLDGPLIPYLKKNSPEIELVRCQSLPIIQRSMFSIGGGILILKLLRNFYQTLKSEGSKERIDLIYVNTLSNFFAIPISRLLKIKVLAHVHEILESPKTVSSFINKYTVRWSTAVLVVSQAVKHNLLKSAGYANADKITVIHNGIPDMFVPKSESKNPKSCIITLISRIKPEKGVWYFLDALRTLKYRENLEVKIIGGPAPFGEKYVTQLKNDILESDIPIDYFPFAPDVTHYLNETDILVVPSLMRDSFPTTVLEGMCCGKLVIATDTGGAIEAITDQESGRIMKNNDVEQFSRILDEGILSKSTREEMGRNARMKYLKSFTVEVYQEKVAAFFNKLVLN